MQAVPVQRMCADTALLLLIYATRSDIYGTGTTGNAAHYKDSARSRSGYVMLDDTFLGNEELITEYAKHMIYEIMKYNGK